MKLIHERIRGFLKRYALYKSTFYLLTYFTYWHTDAKMCRANRTTDVRNPTGVFWVINGLDGTLVWRTKFSRVSLSIAGEADDFINYNAFDVAELLLHAFDK